MLQAELKLLNINNVGIHNLSPGMVTTDLLMAGRLNTYASCCHCAVVNHVLEIVGSAVVCDCMHTVVLWAVALQVSVGLCLSVVFSQVLGASMKAAMPQQAFHHCAWSPCFCRRSGHSS